jgi:predicted nuclease of predicted toxin-antitoxin system
MPRGESKKSKCHCRLHEAPDRHEPQSAMGELLGRPGSGTVHWSTIGQPEASDSEILDFAAENGWIVFTHDLDFGTLPATMRSSAPSVLQVRSQDVLPSAIGESSFARSVPRNHISEPALSSPSTRPVIAFGSYRPEETRWLPSPGRPTIFSGV